MIDRACIKRALLVGAALFSFLRTEPAFAEPAIPEVRDRRWYGWQILASDALSLSIAYTGLRMENGIPVVIGAGGYFVAPLSLHRMNGNAGTIGGVLRVAVPLFGLAAPHDQVQWWMLGLAGGVSVIDASLFSFHEEPPRRPGIAPIVAVTPRLAFAGMAAEF